MEEFLHYMFIENFRKQKFNNYIQLENKKS